MPKTLLLADDSVVIQKLVGLSFANEDVELITADNGDDAIALARDRRPDAVIADVIMPGKSGYEVCETIKQDSQLAHIPVVLLTGTFEAFDEERAEAVGSSGHITKPFEAQALVDRVNELFASTAPAAAAEPAAAPAAAPEPAVELESEGTGGGAFDFFEDDVSDLSDIEAEPLSEDTDPLASPFEAEATPVPDASSDARDAEVLGSDSTVALMPEDANDSDDELSEGLVELSSEPAEVDASATVLAEDLFDAPGGRDESDWLAPPAEAAPDDAAPDNTETVVAELESAETADDGEATVLADDLFEAPEAPMAEVLELEIADETDALPEASEPEAPAAAAWERATPEQPEPSAFDISASDLGEPTVAARSGPEAAPDATGLKATSSSPADAISLALRERVHETLEKVAWEAFSELSEQVVRQVLERVETIAWEVIPQMTETMIREEIRRMKGEDETGS